MMQLFQLFTSVVVNKSFFNDISMFNKKQK